MSHTSATHEGPKSEKFMLPGSYYNSERVFEKEKARLFSKEWVHVGHIGQIPNPGDYFLAKVLNESIIVLRSHPGHGPDSFRAFYNVCRHRGTRICVKDQGHVPGALSCPYHGWS